MTEPEAPLISRLYGMAQHLLIERAHGRAPVATAPRGVVEKADALDAVIHLVSAVDEQVQNHVLPAERGVWIMSLLMVIRDYIEPLPPGIADDGVTDRATLDLSEMVVAIRQGRRLGNDSEA